VKRANLLAEDPTYNQGHFRDIEGVGARLNMWGAKSIPTNPLGFEALTWQERGKVVSV